MKHPAIAPAIRYNQREDTLKKFITVLACGAALALSGTLASAKELAFGTFVPAASPTVTQIYQPWIDWFNEQVADEGYSIKMFAGGSLGRNPLAQAQLVKDGVADLTVTVPSYTPGVFPDYDMFELPGFAGNVREGSLSVLELYQEGKLRGYEDFYVVAVYTTDAYMLHTKPPVGSFEDIAGKRFRVAGQIQTAVVEALGGVPQNMSALEMAENIDRGLIDGAMTDASVAKTFRVTDVAKNHFVTDLGVLVFAVILNKEVYEAMPDKVKEVLAESGQFIADRQIEFYAGAIEANLKSWQEDDSHTVVMASDADANKITEAVQPVVERVSEAAAPGLIDAYSSKLEDIRNR